MCVQLIFSCSHSFALRLLPFFRHFVCVIVDYHSFAWFPKRCHVSSHSFAAFISSLWRLQISLAAIWNLYIFIPFFFYNEKQKKIAVCNVIQHRPTFELDCHWHNCNFIRFSMFRFECHVSSSSMSLCFLRYMLFSYPFICLIQNFAITVTRKS